MTDIADPTVEPEQTDAPATEEKPAKAAPVDKSHPCLCRYYEVYNPASADEVFTTGCEQQTKATFAQGHDARLVSFLVDGKGDGYEIRFVKDGVSTGFGTPGEAVADVSNALQTKAEKAWANRQEKAQGAAERKAAREALAAKRKADKDAKAAEKAAAKEAKANGPKDTGAEVVAGSAEGEQTELQPGQAEIKVGRWSYIAQVDADGNATYVDGSGAEQVRERDGYQLIRSYEA